MLGGATAWISGGWVVAVVAVGLLGVLVGYGIGRQRYRRRLHVLVRQLDEMRARMRQAEQASVSKGDFLANMSHEIRTPLNSMIGTVELMLGTEMSGHQRNQLRIVLSSAEALLCIINDILDFSKIEQNKLALDRMPFVVQALLEEVALLFAPRACEPVRKAKLDLIVQADPTLPTQLLGDPARLRQVLSNLVSNAVKFTAEGYVMLSARPIVIAGGEGVRFSVVDTGIGIAADKCDMVFDKFTQAEGTYTARHFGGTGLGLAICRQLVLLMDGQISMDSAVGSGTSFYVDLPLPAVADDTVQPPLNMRFEGRRALIVDDTMPSAELLRRYLGELGIRAFMGEDGEAAFTTLQHAQDAGLALDYVFVENRLPRGTGAQWIEQSAAVLEHFSPRIIGMSMRDDVHTLRAFNRAGCRGFLRKPVLPSTLLSLLEQMEESTAFVSSSGLGRAPGEESEFPDFHGHNVLLVEDNRANRELALEMLAKFRIEADAAEHGLEALNMATARPYDLILMDCQMPHMDGFAATREMRQRMRSGEMKHAPIIALTANAMKGDRERCLEAGMNDYLSKPLRLQEIRTMLERWLVRGAHEEFAA